MVALALDPRDPLSETFRSAVSARIGEFLAGQREALAPLGTELESLHRMAASLLAGGKRLRPAFCFWSYLATADLPPDPVPLLTAAASLDVLHVSALVHDDLMDASDLRRGRPAAHRQFERLHLDHRWLGEPSLFGQAGAILLGDLLVMWSVEMLRRSGLPAESLAAADPIAEAMRTEVTCGQYLDVVAQARPLPEDGPDPDEAARVVEFKSARYTVRRPCELGAALAGGPPALLDVLAGYGSSLGRAFQFRDDLLGVFGDPQVTGKPAGDDLREGKRTVLIGQAYARTGPAGRLVLRRRLGDPGLTPEGVAELRQVIIDSGARDAVESMIRTDHDEAVATLTRTEMHAGGRTALTALADAAVNRSL